MQNLPTLRQLQYLLALEENLNFQKAADSCNVTQSTLSAGLKDLEETLRAPLIDRSNRKQVRFTPLGHDVLKDARDVIRTMEDLTFRAHSLTKPLSWPLKLGVIPTIAPYFLPRILKPLLADLPALDLHIHELKSSQIIEKIQDGSIDFGLMAFPYDLQNLAHKALFNEDFVIAAPPGAFKGKKDVSMADLSSEKLLLLEDGHCLREHALQACSFHSFAETKSLSAASLSTLIQMVAQGYGITFLPDMAVADKNTLPAGLTIRPFKSHAPSRQIGLVWKKDGLRAEDITMVKKSLIKLVKAN